MTYLLSAIMNFKIIINNACSDQLELNRKSIILDLSIEVQENLPLSYMIKEMPFSLMSVTCSIWTVVYHLKYFMLQ